MVEELRLPMIGGRVEAGFPSPADDFIERSLDLNEQLIQQGLTLDVTPDAKRWLAEKGFDAHYGARPLKRAIQKHLEDILSDEMLKGRFTSGGLIEVSLQDDSLVFVEKSGALNVG